MTSHTCRREDEDEKKEPMDQMERNDASLMSVENALAHVVFRNNDNYAGYEEEDNK